MNNDKQFIDFKKEVEKLKEIDGAEEYAKQLAHLFLGNGLSLQTILLMAIDFGQQHPQWIPVEEKLPEENEEVLAYNAENEEVIACDYHHKMFHCWPEVFGKSITHWMPLPVPPQGKEDKK